MSQGKPTNSENHEEAQQPRPGKAQGPKSAAAGRKASKQNGRGSKRTALPTVIAVPMEAAAGGGKPDVWRYMHLSCARICNLKTNAIPT